MLKTIKRSMKFNQILDMIYMDDSGKITKRRIKVFKVDNVLALVPSVKSGFSKAI